jgi:stearoyl-CoA desaturase (delta-9 desaturase)
MSNRLFSPRIETERRSGSAAARWQWLTRWFDNRSVYSANDPHAHGNEIDWLRTFPFVVLHLGCLGVLWVGVSPVAAWTAVGLYFIRMFAITAGYHRYFSHRSFETSRVFQFILAVLANSAAQRGPLWWAAHHRHHHRHSDEEHDVHSPHHHGFLESHVTWFMTPANFHTDEEAVRDLAQYPELRFLNRFDCLVPLLLGLLLYASGEWMAWLAPGLETNGWQMLFWGFFVSTVVTFHATAAINSLAHWMGRRRYKTRDESRNSFLLALLTLGEGWHNNHHYYPGATRQGFYWWEIDITYQVLRVLSWFGVVWNLRGVPERVLEKGRAA